VGDGVEVGVGDGVVLDVGAEVIVGPAVGIVYPGKGFTLM